MNNWKIATIILAFLCISLIALSVYRNSKEVTYDFGKLKIPKEQFDNLVEASGTPAKLCKVDSGECVIIKSLK